MATKPVLENSPTLLEFSSKLLDWYWGYGSKRQDTYALPRSGWVRDLYDVQRGLSAIEEAKVKTRPAVAVWGPSQCGKSTLVSTYLDENTIFVNKEGEDGKNSALYWEGGAPAFFMFLPEKAGDNVPPWIQSLNPFTLGSDASACLSRFVYASTEPTKGIHHVKYPQFPIEFKFVRPAELLLALARGYDSECLAPTKSGIAKHWTLDEFKGALHRVKTQRTGNPGPLNRAAFEKLCDLCEVLDDLVFGEIPRFQRLLDDGESIWRSLNGSLLDDPAFVGSPELVQKLAAELLWDGIPTLTEYYQKTEAGLAGYRKIWGDRVLHCDIDAASLFLDMDACRLSFETPSANASPDSKESKTRDRIRRLAYNVDADCVFIGCSASLPNKMNLNAESFSILQGAVWEILIPINPANLSDTAFKRFLEKADLLDFPGVGNEVPNQSTRINFQTTPKPAAPAPANPANPGEEPELPKGRPFQPSDFFRYVLKRGKTASIVSTYAKRLTIDSFCILQALDKNPPPNAGQLITGINTWWKHLVPEYYRNQSLGKSPLALNLVLTMWAALVKEAPADAAEIFGKTNWIYSKLGKIADPQVAYLFALNYYFLPRGEVSPDRFSKSSSLYGRIVSEAEFKRMYGEPVSRNSFDAMVEDRVRGGTEYFFTEVSTQVGGAVAKRQELLSKKAESLIATLVDRLNAGKLFPEPQVRDVRRELLQELQVTLKTAVRGKEEPEVRQVNYAIREMVNVDYQALQPIPDDLNTITPTFIRQQMLAWINSRVESFQQSKKRKKGEGPDWSTIGLDSQEKLRNYLEALVASLEPDLDAIHALLRDLVSYRNAHPQLGVADLRRFLALRMGNAIVFGKIGIPVFDASASDYEEVPVDDSKLRQAVGEACPSYKAFISPFIEQIQRMTTLNVKPMQRPDDIPGDKELVVLCKQYSMLPEKLQGKS